jgi:cholesterol oxidase
MSEDKTSIHFSEQMTGFLSRDELTDYEKAFRQGQQSGVACSFNLTIRIADIEFFVRDPNEQAAIDGTVDCPMLGGNCDVEKGIFNLLVDAVPGRDDVKYMRYRLFLVAPDSSRYTLSGRKVVKDDGTLHIWRDTTTLFTKILAGHVSEDAEATAKVVACGILHLHPMEFAKLLTTMGADGPSFAARIEALEQFGKLFLGTLWDIYGPKSHQAPAT